MRLLLRMLFNWISLCSTLGSLFCTEASFLWCTKWIPPRPVCSHSIHIWGNPHANTCPELWVSIYKEKMEWFCSFFREQHEICSRVPVLDLFPASGTLLGPWRLLGLSFDWHCHVAEKREEKRGSVTVPFHSVIPNGSALWCYYFNNKMHIRRSSLIPVLSVTNIPSSFIVKVN